MNQAFLRLRADLQLLLLLLREALDTWSNLSLWVVAPGIPGLPQQEQEELEISTEGQKGVVHMTGEAF